MPTHGHTSVNALQPRLQPSVALSPYERQIVGAISRWPESQQPCSGTMKEVAAHKQALLATSHKLLSALHSQYTLLSVLDFPVCPLFFMHSYDLRLHFHCYEMRPKPNIY